MLYKNIFISVIERINKQGSSLNTLKYLGLYLLCIDLLLQTGMYQCLVCEFILKCKLKNKTRIKKKLANSCYGKY